MGKSHRLFYVSISLKDDVLGVVDGEIPLHDPLLFQEQRTKKNNELQKVELIWKTIVL